MIYVLFWFADTSQFTKETILCIDADEIDVTVAEYSFDFIAFVFAHQTMVNKDAGQLVADCFGEQFCNNRAVYTAGQSQQNFAVSTFSRTCAIAGVAVILHAPVANCAADIVKEVAQHLAAVLGMFYFRMILGSRRSFCPDSA